MQDFLSMGGYGAYVWSSYGLSALVLGALLVASIMRLKRTQADFERLKALTGRRAAGSARTAKAGEQKQETETPNGNEA